MDSTSYRQEYFRLQIAHLEVIWAFLGFCIIVAGPWKSWNLTRLRKETRLLKVLV